MAFQQGLSGLNGAAKSLDVIGNNIANASTVGFKSSRNEFADIYATSLYGMNNTNVGIGAKLAAVTQQFNQGNISTSSSPLDLAISGEGFFQLNQNGLTTYTRNGQFKMDSSGFIVDSTGRNLTGNLADASGTIIGGPAVPLSVSLGVVPPSQTTAANITANLNYTAEVPPGAVFGGDFDDPVTQINPSTPSTYNYSTTVNVFDPAGTAMGLSLYFQKAGTGQWNVAGYIAGNRVLPQTTDAITPDAPIALTFDRSGRLAAISDTGTDSTTNAAALQATIDLATTAGASLAQIYRVIDTAVDVQVAANKVTPEQMAAAAAAYQSAVGASNTGVIDDVRTAALTAKNSLPISVPFPNSTTDFWDFNLDLTKLTQYGSTSGVSFVSQDGYTAGQFSNLSVDKTGLVQGTYTNGRTLSLGQVHLTSFLNPNGLQSLGDNQWAETAAAGRQNSDAPGNGLLGYLQSGAVEESNVDLTAELVSLIVAQRMYQANAQTISAQSTVLQTLVNLR